jgi:hypothetical protein
VTDILLSLDQLRSLKQRAQNYFETRSRKGPVDSAQEKALEEDAREDAE